MAGILGLVIAVALAIPRGVVAPSARTAGPSAPVAPAAAKPNGPPTGSHTMLLVDIASGTVVVNVNNKAVSTLHETTSFDLAPFVQPGKNKVMLRWSGPVQAEVHILRATGGDEYREAGRAFLTRAGTQSAGDETVLFYL